MQVKRSVLQDLSTNELMLYIKDDSRFVPEAIKMAYEILKHERNIQFSDKETLRVQNLISSKITYHENEENKNSFEPNLVEDSEEHKDKPKLHTQGEIVFHSAVFFSFAGAYLLHNNLKKLNKSSKKNTLFLIIYVISMLVFDYYLYEYMINHQKEFNQIKYNRYGNLGIFFTIRGIVNFIIVSVIWNYFFGKNLQYD